MEDGIYPVGPPPAGKEIFPGEGMNIRPLEGVTRWDFTGPVGLASKAYLSLSIHLIDLGYTVKKYDEYMFVTPLHSPVYERLAHEKEALEEKIKRHLASIATAINDLELAKHDLRKYKEFMKHIERIEKGEKLIKEGKKEEGEKLRREGDQTLRAIFIDQVDVHTGEGISLRSIVIRWPTIISDFMKLTDEDKDPSQIAKKLKVSEAEGVVLATKNKLYLDWREMFKRVVKERYETLVKLVEARRNSVIEYKEMVKPLIARYKILREALQTKKGRATILTGFLKPNTQAFTLDVTRLWAWKPFAPREKYKVGFDVIEKIPAREAGFTREEEMFIQKMLVKEGKLEEGEKVLVPALPIPKAYDRVLRVIVSNLEKKYKITITPYDVYKAIEELATEFEKAREGTRLGEAWFFTPYFVFLDITMGRLVYRFPDGSEFEDLDCNPVRTAVNTQNIILGRIIELHVKEKLLEMEINKLLGELAAKDERWVKVQQILKEEFPVIYGEPEKKEKKKPKKKFELGEAINKLLKFFGWEVWLVRGKGPYELAFFDRFTKYYINVAAKEMFKVQKFLCKIFKVP